MDRNLRLFLGLTTLLTVASWLAGLFLPALILQDIDVPDRQYLWRGYDCLWMSLLAPLIGHYEILANILLAISIALLWSKLWKSACLTSLMSLAFSLQTLFLTKTQIYMDEGGVKKSVLSKFDIGFYLWIVSIVVPLIVAGILALKHRSKPISPDQR